MREAVCWLRKAEMNFLWHRLLQACVVLVILKGEWQLFYVLSGTTLRGVQLDNSVSAYLCYV